MRPRQRQMDHILGRENEQLGRSRLLDTPRGAGEYFPASGVYADGDGLETPPSHERGKDAE